VWSKGDSNVTYDLGEMNKGGGVYREKQVRNEWRLSLSLVVTEKQSLFLSLGI
jgi:hypothetical protein